MDQLPVSRFSVGVNQGGQRDYNARLALSLVQRHGGLSGSELARHAGLSPQTASVILRRLEAEGLVARAAPRRGRVGKPSQPMVLAADGAFAVGLKIGRRSADLCLLDFAGAVRAERLLTYRYPLPGPVLAFLAEGLRAFAAALGPRAARLAGVGIAMPFELWSWHETLGAPKEAFMEWRGLDLPDRIAAFSPLPVYLDNDATAACRAEHMFGRGRSHRDYAYVFVGSFIGGGVVLNNSVYEGRRGNAGAFGSLPSRLAGEAEDRQLLDTASLHLLEAALARAGHPPGALWSQPQDWRDFEPQIIPWLAATAAALSRACVALASVIDFEAVVIDGAFPAALRARLVEQTAHALAGQDSRGILVPAIVEGMVGGNARAIGAAVRPFVAQYFLDTNSGLAAL